MSSRTLVGFTSISGLALIMVVVGHAAPSVAAGLRDLQDGWLMTAEDAASVLQRSEFPAGEDDGSEIFRSAWISAGKMRLYGMPDLPVTALAGGGSGIWWGKRWLAGFCWERTGSDLFVEDRKQFHFGAGRKTILGLDCSLSRMWIGGELEATHVGAAVTLVHNLVVRERTLIRIGWFFDVVDPAPWFGRHGRRPLGYVCLLQPGSRFGSTLALDRRGDGTPGLSLDISAGLVDRFGLGLRVDFPTGALGPITIWKSGLLLIRTSHVAHPELGLTHRVSMTVGVLGTSGK